MWLFRQLAFCRESSSKVFMWICLSNGSFNIHMHSSLHILLTLVCGGRKFAQRLVDQSEVGIVAPAGKSQCEPVFKELI